MTAPTDTPLKLGNATGLTCRECGTSVPQEGLYIAHLSAAATVASVPVIIVGWIAQRSLVRGLSMGAIK